MLAELQTHFRPEFLNRVDDVVVFRTLTRRTSKIGELQLGRIRAGGWRPRHAPGDVGPDPMNCWANRVMIRLRGAAAQAGDPARTAESHRDAGARREVHRGRHDPRAGAGRQARLPRVLTGCAPDP